jgi:predicted alpha-1,2-mannosidase
LFGALCLASGLAVPAAGAATSAEGSAPGTQTDLTSLVDPFVGTGSGGPVVGSVDMFPGADVPFGMVQWSPDTSPDGSSGGGYTYTDSQISGFSLTHLSGPGCSIYGDVPILPVTGAVPADPGTATEPFSHSTESAAPGRYQVSVGSPATTVALSATTRTGLGEFTFPPSVAANLLFKVSGSQSGIHLSSVSTIGSDEIEGSVESGYFCQTLEHYTLHFVAVFSQPFTSHGTWSTGKLAPGSSSCSGTFQADCGAWVTFDTTHDQTVGVKVGLSYVSAANAALNLRDEDTGWNLANVEAKATDAWNAMLGRIDLQGGTETQRQVFYTALYHCLLDPSTFSDDNGQYIGFDNKVRNDDGHTQYANFSEWDIYRSEMPLLAMIDPAAVSNMIRSLLNDASQGGWLPVLAIANGDSGVMDGDSADPVIADAYAFGVRGFDATQALHDMLKGAEKPGVGLNNVPERPNLAEYEKLGFVPQNDVDPDSVGETIGASETLEYSIDDFTVAQVAEALGDPSAAKTMMASAQNWQSLFNPATGYVQARQADGSFPAGPALQDPSPLAMLDGIFQAGFAEGNAVQYTWSVPQDLGGLFALIGGDKQATADLGQFFQQLNAGPWEPYDWSGNEPSLWTPWEFDYSGAPSMTQAAVRTIATTEYGLSPAGEPGNDDLGAMSSWYVWAALGLYPVTPGTANLAVASPMFPEATVHLAHGKTLNIEAQGTPNVFVASATLATGAGAPQPLEQDWLPASVVRGGGTVDFTLAPTPNTAWASNPVDAPPSYGEAAGPAVGFTQPSGSFDVSPGTDATVTLGAQSDTKNPTTLDWHVTSTSGVQVSPSSGVLQLGAESAEGSDARSETTLHLTATGPGAQGIHVAFSDPGHGGRIPSVTLDVKT